MKYIDTGSRDPAQAVGTWLQSVLDPSIVALRCQTGFFGANVLGIFTSTFANLEKQDLPLSVLVGSNDGTTPSADVESLLKLSGSTRTNRHIGVVSFDSGYFHPKVIHLVRADGSAAAYVGSANLTESGVASLHVEAGVLLDSRDNDDAAVIQTIADSIDWWFQSPRDGLSIVESAADLSALVSEGILDVPSRPIPVRPPPRAASGRKKRRGFVLRHLLTLPSIQASAVTSPPAARSKQPTPKSRPSPTVPARWGKPLTTSDAQRKTSGHQRGSITLVRSRFSIDAQTYFRHDFFASVAWIAETTRTGKTRETASVPFDITILGKALGVRQVMISHAPNRESGQANYTSLLHLHPELSPYFTRANLTGKWLEMERRSDGSYTLRVLAKEP